MAFNLPIFQCGEDGPSSRDFVMMQNQWKRTIDPALGRPANNSNILTGVALANGVTVVNHKLGRQMQGWSIVDTNGAAQIYRSAPLNELTLTLTSNAAVTVAIEVF